MGQRCKYKTKKYLKIEAIIQNISRLYKTSTKIAFQRDETLEKIRSSPKLEQKKILVSKC